VGGDQIDLRWEAPPGAGGSIYRVYWDQGSGYRTYALRTSVHDARYTDLGLKPSTTYRYFVTTFDGQAESSPVGLTVETCSWLRLPLMRLTMSAAANPTISTTPMPLPTSSASSPLPQPAEVILGLMGSNDYVDDLGNLHLVGEVHNDVRYNVDGIRVDVTFYDDSGDVVEAVTGSALLDLLVPGQRSPFVIVWENPGEWKRYSLRATARPTTARPTEGLALLQSYARLDENGLYHVVGTLRNDGLTTPYYVRVVVSLYDSFGRISNAGFAYARPSRIPPGTAASFDCPFEYYPYLAEHLVQMSEQ
jgi:hypothetical protein